MTAGSVRHRGRTTLCEFEALRSVAIRVEITAILSVSGLESVNNAANDFAFRSAFADWHRVCP
jgi:hypothetical protein